MSIKRTIITTIVALSVVAMVAPGVAQGITVDELLAQIQQLTAQLNALQGGTTPSGSVPTACVGVTFTRNLTVGSTGSDVKCLQAVLNLSATTQVATTGAGAPGYETTTFGPKTLVAVKKYQTAHGFTPANQVGPMTRQALNAQLAGGTPNNPPVNPTAGGLSVTLASDSPAATTVATGANANFAKILLTAGTGDVSVSRLYITRSGLSANADLQNLELVDSATGAYVGNIGSLNSDNRAALSFVPALKVSAGTTRAFYLKSGVKTTATAGHTVVLGIASASDVTSNATSVAGSFPVNGNPMSVISLTVGSVTVYEDGSVPDSAPDVGSTDVIVNQFKVTASSTEPVTIETITAKRLGSASVSDVANIKLYDVTNGKLLGTVSAWDTYDKAVWSNLNLVVDKGKTVRFKITLDVTNGAGSTKTVNADIIDGSDVLVVVKGNTYGYYITPSIGSGWDGEGNANQTIQNGSLVVSKSTLTPPTGNITSGNDVTLGVFDFDAKGEDVKVTQVVANFTNTVGGWAPTDLTKVAIYDANGNIVAGPVDTNASLVATFTDTFIVPVGVHPYTVKATIADSADTNDTIRVGLDDPYTSILATGMLSSTTILPTPNGSDVNANTLTVAGVGMAVTTLGSPAGRSIPKGTSDFIFATFALDAGSAGENIQVTSIVTTDSLGGSAAAADIDNAELWADLTTANSSRGDAYETKISNTYQPSAGTQTFTISPALVVNKGTTVKVALVADVNSGAGDGNHTFYVTTSGVVANGATTGNALGTTTLSYTSSSKQTMSTTSNGTLTVSRDSNSPVADIVLGNATGVTLTKFDLYANNVEDLDLDQLTFDCSKGNYVSTFYFYDGGTDGSGTKLIGTAPGAVTGTVIFPDGSMTIPANTTKVLVVKADLYPVDGTTVSNGDTIKFGVDVATNIKTTGKLSGQSVTSSRNIIGLGMNIYGSRPYITKNTTLSPSGQITPLSDQLLAVFDVRADALGDVYFGSDVSDQIKVTVEATINDTTQGELLFTLKDSDGNTLDSNVQAAASTTTRGALSTTVTFPFSTSLTVGAGATKQLYVYGNLTDFEDSGDSIRVSLSPTAAYCKFGLKNSGSYSGAYSEGDKIFKNTVYGNSLTRTTQ